MDNQNQDGPDVIIQENYHKDSMSKYFFVLVFGAALVFGLLSLSAYIIAEKPRPKYFVTDQQNKIFASLPLNMAIYNDPQLRDWVSQMVIQLFDMNYLNYQSRAQRASSIFIGDGYKKYLSIISASDLPTIVNGKFVSKASLCNIAKIDPKTTGVFNINNVDNYIWTVTVPIYIQYQSEQSYAVVAKVVARVQRVSELDYLGGLAISDIDVSNRTMAGPDSTGSSSVCNG